MKEYCLKNISTQRTQMNYGVLAEVITINPKYGPHHWNILVNQGGEFRLYCAHCLIVAEGEFHEDRIRLRVSE